MIVDCHTHIDSPDSSLSCAEHLEACRQLDVCFVLANDFDDSDQVNTQLSHYVKKHRKMIGFGVVNPLNEKVNKIFNKKRQNQLLVDILDRGYLVFQMTVNLVL